MCHGTAVLVYLKGALSLKVYYVVSFFVSVKVKYAASESGQVQLIVGIAPRVVVLLVLVKEHPKVPGCSAEAAPVRGALFGVVIAS